MVGANVEVHEGKNYLVALKSLGVIELGDVVKTRRVFEPKEGVESKAHLWFDSVAIADAKRTRVFSYLFVKSGNNVFLWDIVEGDFTDRQRAYYDALAVVFSKGAGRR